MGRANQFVISESLEELESYKSRIDKYHIFKRLEVLIRLKKGDYQSQEALGASLGVSSSSITKWVRTYRREGIKELLRRTERKRASQIITPEIHEALVQKLHDEQNPFTGYVEVQKWIRDRFGAAIKYPWLYKYMRTKLGSRLKVPRKVHAEKEEEAAGLFFKNA